MIALRHFIYIDAMCDFEQFIIELLMLLSAYR